MQRKVCGRDTEIDKYRFDYLFLVFKFLTVEAIEQQGKKEVEHHKVPHYERRQEDKEAAFSAAGLLCSHTIPKRLDPLSTQNPEYHHERVEEVVEIPPWIISKVKE